MRWFGIALGVIAIVCVLLPPRWDPAIRMKMWLDAMDKEPPPDHDESEPENHDH